MMYNSYQALADVGDSVRLLASNAERILKTWASGPFQSPFQRMAAYYEVVALAGFTHDRPGFEIPSVEVRGVGIPVEEEVVLSTDFCDLRRFRKTGAVDEPKVLLVAPMSGHFATLLRGTLKTMLRDHEVYVTDWINPREDSAGSRPLRARRLHPAYRRFHRAIGPDFAYRRRLPARGLGARRDCGDGPGGRQSPTGEPDADGGADRHPHLARPRSTISPTRSRSRGFARK